MFKTCLRDKIPWSLFQRKHCLLVLVQEQQLHYTVNVRAIHLGNAELLLRLVAEYSQLVCVCSCVIDNRKKLHFKNDYLYKPFLFSPLELCA